MIRGLALTASLLFAGAPALAQTHPPHPRMPHDPATHTPLDSARHAALHALLLGSWVGTFSSPHGDLSALDLKITHDSLRKMMLTLHSEHYGTVGPASDVALKDNQLQWTHDVSGTTCKATAVVTAATELAPETMKGTMKCDGHDGMFTLHKKTG